MKVMILGAGGMLGKALVQEARLRFEAVVGLGHHECPINERDRVRLSLTAHAPDVIINAAGVLPDIFGKSTLYGGQSVAMVMTNALGPHVLATEAKAAGAYLIQVSTDCVFSGLGPPANQPDDPPDPRDVYGRSKLLGETILEISPAITVARTSFIGFEHGLLAWYIDAALKSATIEGYRNAYWSGSSVHHVARAILDLCLYRPGGIQHIGLKKPITKAVLLHLLNSAFGFRVPINEVDKPYIARGLVPTIELPDIQLAAQELAEEYKRFVN